MDNIKANINQRIARYQYEIDKLHEEKRKYSAVDFVDYVRDIENRQRVLTACMNELFYVLRLLD